MHLQDIPGRLRPHAPGALPGLAMVALMLVWAAHDGGYDSDTWYWGALLSLALLVAVIGSGLERARPSRALELALLLFTLYVAWSYLSISWAQSPGDALQGSNRALLYLLVFALMAILPWTVQAAAVALITFAVGIGVIAVVLLVRLASVDHLETLIAGGRLVSPTGYFNSTAALFTISGFVSIGLGSRREIPGLLRGLLLALAGASLQLAVVVQSRGWLFTLPLVALTAAFVVRQRIRFALAAVIPVAVTVIPVRSLLHIYDTAHGGGLATASAHAARPALVLCGAAFVLATLLAWADGLSQIPRPSPARMRVLGSLIVALTLAGGVVGALAVSHGQPFRYISRQWNGFSHQQRSSTGSHFGDVGSGRYDFWRVSLDAFAAHPIGGLGQDNFDDYYVTRRRTYEEPQWTHSLEMRLLAHTGIVGLLLFAGFLVSALVAAARARRRLEGPAGAIAGLALLPLIVWLVHGSIDWFWEIPALSGPALGFLAMAGALGAAPEASELVAPRATGWTVPRRMMAGLATVALLAGAAALAFPYLSVREVSLGSDVRTSDPAAALHDLATAASLNPLSADPGRLAGAIALQNGDYATAEQRFRQAVAREPGGWFAWLGAGLAASARGRRTVARHDFAVAYSINNQQPAVIQARARIGTARPLTSAQAFRLLVLVH